MPCRNVLNDVPTRHSVSSASGWGQKRASRILKPICHASKDNTYSQKKCGDKFEAPVKLYEAVYPPPPDRCRSDTESASSTVSSRPPNTVYTIRITTAYDRASGLGDLNSGVQVCMIGRKGEALMHRIPQIEDHVQSFQTMQEICKVVDASAGANCDLPDTSDSKYNSSSKYIKRRFQDGSVDELSFAAPDLGPLKAILIGPEYGKWALEEVSITNSRENLTQRFVCRDVLGDDSDQGAAYMTALPPGAVIYGSGNSAVLMTQDQAESMRNLGLKEYDELKERVLRTTAAFVVAGVVISGLAGGVEAAEAFAFGGCIAFIYQMLLNKGLDSLPLGATYNGSPYGAPDILGKQVLTASRRDDWMREMLGSGPFRLAATTGFMLAALLSVQLLHDDVSGKERTVLELTAVLTALLGFATYKVAMVAVTLTPSVPVEEKARTIEKL